MFKDILFDHWKPLGLALAAMYLVYLVTAGNEGASGVTALNDCQSHAFTNIQAGMITGQLPDADTLKRGCQDLTEKAL